MKEDLRAEEVALALKVSVHCIANWRRAGLIPFVKLGPRTIRFNLDDVVAALKARQSEKTHAAHSS